MAVKFALALHGGAGVIVRQMDPTKSQLYLDALGRILDLGLGALKKGGTALDVVEEVVVALEEEPLFNAGKGAAFNAAGEHELEASIMDGRTRDCGSVIGVRTVRNPIRLARLVMTESEHVAFGGAGAELFADRMEVERVENSWFSTETRRAQWEKARSLGEGTLDDIHDDPDAAPGALDKGTVGCVALDRDGSLAAATSTGGRTNKAVGRIGDSPILGAGNYANECAAVSGTGVGEQFVRHTVAREVAALVEYRGSTLREAAAEVVWERLNKGDGGVIAVGRDGSFAMPFNTEGMFRAAGDSEGQRIVKIWD